MPGIYLLALGLSSSFSRTPTIPGAATSSLLLYCGFFLKGGVMRSKHKEVLDGYEVLKSLRKYWLRSVGRINLVLK